MRANHRGVESSGRRLQRGIVSLLAVLALLAVACGGGETVSGTDTDGADTGDDGDATGVPAFDGTIPLGVILSLTGGQSDRSQAALYGLRAGVAEVNEQGGVEVDGRRYSLELIVEDTRGDATTAATAATGLLEDEDVDIVFGPAATGEIAAVAPLTAEKPALLMATTASAVVFGAVGQPGDPTYDYSYGYLVCGCDSFPAWVRQIKTLEPDASTAGFFFEDDPVGAFLDGVFTEAFEAEGLEVIAKEFYPPDASEFSAQLTNLKEAGPDVVFFGFLPQISGTILKQASELQVAPLLFSPDPFSIATEGGGIDIDYLAVVGGGVYGPSATTDERQEFGSRLQELNGGEELPVGEFTYYTAGAYSTVHLLALAMENVQSIDDIEAINEVLTDVTFDMTATDTYFFDPETHQARGASLDSTLVRSDGTVTRITFNAEGTEIIAERDLE